MCNPVATSIVGSAFQLKADNDAYIAEQNYQDAVKKQGTDSANRALAASTLQINYRLSQEHQANAQSIMANMVRGAKAQATLRTSAGESGVSGNSVNTLLNDYYRQESFFNQSVLTNQQFQDEQHNAEYQGLLAQRDNRLASLIMKPPTKPNMFSYFGKTIGAAGDSYAAGGYGGGE